MDLLLLFWLVNKSFALQVDFFILFLLCSGMFFFFFFFPWEDGFVLAVGMKFFFFCFLFYLHFFLLSLSVCVSLSLSLCVWGGYVWDDGGRMGLNYTSKAHQAEQEASKTPERGEVSAGFPLGNVFALQEPKHALAGLSGAAQNLVVGVGVGLGSLLALPVVNGHRDGAKGVAKGVAMGVAALVGMTTYGVATGARQFAKGVYNTKEAVVEAARGERYWDSQQGRWVDVHLDSAFAELPAGDEDLFTQAREAFGKMFTGISSNTTHASEGAAAAPLKDYYAIMGVQGRRQR
ncbi:chaperone DnaJ protein, putative, partial [Trypanosoma cruzi]